MAVSPFSVVQMHQLALCKHAMQKNRGARSAKWIPVFRPIALQNYKWRMILSAEPRALRRDHAQRIINLKN